MTLRSIAVSTMALLPACMPPDVALGPSSHDTEVDPVTSSSTSDSTSSAGIERTPQCERSYDCAAGESCIGGVCTAQACPGGCCPPTCCRDCDVQCEADEHCPLGESCVAGSCFPPTRVCAETPRFDAMQPVPTEATGCNAVAFVQSDGDSAQEIVAATHAGLVLVDTEAGVSEFSATVAVQLLVADFDGDGDDDLAVRDEADRVGDVAMYTQTLGTFVDDGVVELGPGHLAAGDLGDDGVHDLFVARPAARGFALHAAIARVPTDLGLGLDSDAFVVAPIDLHHPGADLLARIAGWTVLLAGHDTFFDTGQNFPDPLDLEPNLGRFATNFSRADELDGLSVHTDGASTYVGTGSGLSRSYTVPLVGAVATVGDVDADGHGDIVVAGAGVLAVLRGAEAECYSIVGIAIDPISLAVGDHDGDGIPDVLTCDGTSLTLFRGRPR